MFMLESFHYLDDISSILMCFFNASRFITARHFDVCCVNSHNLSKDKNVAFINEIDRGRKKTVSNNYGSRNIF
jgi:hypothetical protein